MKKRFIEYRVYLSRNGCLNGVPDFRSRNIFKCLDYAYGVDFLVNNILTSKELDYWKKYIRTKEMF